MDLYAYANITDEDIEKIIKENDIVVPRLRGYELMLEECEISLSELKEVMDCHRGDIYERAVRAIPKFHPDSNMSEYSSRTDKLAEKFLIRQTVTDDYGDTYKKTIGIRWNLIHGKNRKALKFALKKSDKAVRSQIETWNKYVGRRDVLCIHARIGGANWNYYQGYLLEKKPWFLEKVDDYSDGTYCDIYARIT